MEMGECRKDSLSLEEFRDKCRICLRNHGDMTDALASGISNTVMEVINIKITWNDELPKCICQDCWRQIEVFYKFQSLAKDSDNYLRALLLAEKCFSKENGNDKLEILSEKKKKKKNNNNNKNNKFQKSCARKKFNYKHYDKMYLIHVDRGGEDSESQSEIYIKDLNSENDNLELTDFCKSLVKARSMEPSHPEEELEKDFPCDPDGNLMAESLCNTVFKENWFIYQCDQCSETFQTKDDLSEHLKVSHGNEDSMNPVNYTCRVFAKSVDDKNLHLEHFETHKTEGLPVLEVDGTGQCPSINDLTKESFLAPKTFDHQVIKNRVYKVNTSCYRCFLCQKLEPAESVNDHLKVCFPDFQEEQNYLTPHLKFTCPACSTSWIDDCEYFKQHLLAHRENNVFFVKINILGEPAELTEEDFMFTPFEKALEALKFDEGESGGCAGSKIIKMRSLFSCQVCDFEATSVNSLSEHYLEIHGSLRPISRVCPVCHKDFKFLELREMSDFQSHLINHKQEGICFLKIDADGAVVSGGSDGSGLFSGVNELLLGRPNCPELEFMSNTSVPVVYVERTGDREDGEYLTKKKDIAVTRLKDFTKKENKCGREYICEKCGKECSGKVNYRRHFLTHAKDTEACGQKRPKCSVCDKTFSTRAILTEHKRHHSEKEVGNAEDSARAICEICGRGLPNNASLAKHRKLHARERNNEILKCKICGRNFRRESALNRHLSAHMNPNYFECGECKLPLPSMASLERHKLGHQSSANTHDCNVCKVSFLTKDRLTAHETHTGHNQNRKRFECNVCHERFFIGREFTKHIKLHPKYKMSECALCGKRLSTMQSLMLHLDRHFESNSILCPHCGKQCFEERNYRRHLLTHKGVKPFACDVEGCNKSFYTYFEVKRHKKYHNNTRDFNCPYCPKSFHEANHLKVHIRTHTGERPYTCPHCNKSFVTRTRCKQHISLVHQGVGFDLIQSTISKKVAVFETIDTPA